jgi:hypothetical protein
MEKKTTLLTFCVKAVALLVILFGVDRLVGATFVVMKDVALARNPYHEWTKTAYILDKCDAECLVVGSSKAERSYVTDILQDSLQVSVYDGGQGGCFFLFQNCVVNMLLDRGKPKLIIWDVQPECLPEGSTMQEYQNVRYLSPYYDSDSWARDFVDSEDSRAAVKMQCQMFRYNTKLVQYVMPILGGGKKTKGGYSPLPICGYKYPVLKDGIVKAEALMVKLDEYKLNVYEKTLSRCKENNVDMTILISPSYSIKGKAYKEAVVKLAEVAKRYGYQLMDFSSDERFMCDSTLFKDASHLNDRGARMYTSIVAAALNDKK